MNILIVDDDEVCRDTLANMLSKHSYEVLLAANGREALEKLASNDCKMVISDWVMPEVNGPTLCRAIRSASFGSYIFIILLTVRDSPQDIIEGLDAGADEFMTKPFHLGEVRARVRTGERILALESRVLQGPAGGQPINTVTGPSLAPPSHFPYPVRQWAAPCFNGNDPDVDDFVSVECRELYQGGVSFESDVLWESDKLVITLGGGHDLLFMFSQVIDQRRATNQHGSLVYRLDCHFLRRVNIDTRRWVEALCSKNAFGESPLQIVQIAADTIAARHLLPATAC